MHRRKFLFLLIAACIAASAAVTACSGASSDVPPVFSDTGYVENDLETINAEKP